MPEPMNRRLGVLISGRGTNLQALIDAIKTRRLNATIAIVISNHSEAAGLDRARVAGIDAITLPHRAYATRDAYDRALVKELQARDVGLVCLAGFMRLVGEPLIEAFPNRILNIHPSLLPAFPGLDAQTQAIEHGVKVSGVTVHLVTAELDGGPIVIQRPVPVMPGDTADTLATRILEQEHLAYPEAVRMILDGGWRVDGRRFVAAKSPTSAST
jgi:phosphoribosylglycinamide formyltransferase-1